MKKSQDFFVTHPPIRRGDQIQKIWWVVDCAINSTLPASNQLKYTLRQSYGLPPPPLKGGNRLYIIINKIFCFFP